MAVLVIGLILFLGPHSLGLIAPAWREGTRARLGEGAYKAAHSIVSLIGIVIMVWGCALASADPAVLYSPAPGLHFVPETLMLVALVLFVASLLPAGHIKRFVGHPLLIATVLWSASHLFVNGDSAGVVLFAAFLVWAAVSLLVVWQKPQPVLRAAPPALGSDIVAVVAGVVLYGALVWRVHFWLFGVSPMH